MNFIRTYSGTVTSLRQEHISAFGMRTYSVYFRGGKKAFFEISKKRTLPIAVGEYIRFTGHFLTTPKEKVFFIDEVLDSTWMDKVYSYEEERKMKNISA